MTEFETAMVEKMGAIARNMNAFKANVDIQNKEIANLKAHVEAQNKEIANLKAHVATQLSPEKLQAIGVRAVKEATFSGENMENFVKYVGENFDNISDGLDFAFKLIREESQKTRNAIPSSVGARGMFS